MSATDMGKYGSLEEASNSVVLEETYQPQEYHHKTYQKFFEIFERVTSKLADEFEDIAKLQQKH
jgi:gluconokinase